MSKRSGSINSFPVEGGGGTSELGGDVAGPSDNNVIQPLTIETGMVQDGAITARKRSWTRTTYELAGGGISGPTSPQTPPATLWTQNDAIMFTHTSDTYGLANVVIDAAVTAGSWIVSVQPGAAATVYFTQGSFTTGPSALVQGAQYHLVLDPAQGLAIDLLIEERDLQSFSAEGLWERRAPLSTVFLDSTAAPFVVQMETTALADGDQVTFVDVADIAGTNPVTLTPVETLTYSVTYTAAQLAATLSPSFEYAIPALDGKTISSIVLSGVPFAGASGAITAGIRTSGGAFYFAMTDVTDGTWNGLPITDDTVGTIPQPTARFEIAGGGNFDPASGYVTFTFTYTDPSGTINGATSYDIDTNRGWVTLVWDEANLNWSIVAEAVVVDQSQLVVSATSGATTLAQRARQFVKGNSSGGAVTVNFPLAPLAGDVVIFKDSEGTAATNNYTLNGNGKVFDNVTSITVSIAYTAYTMVYDGAKWGIV